MRVGCTRVGVAVGYIVTTIGVGVRLFVAGGCLVKVGEAGRGNRVGVDEGRMGGAVVGIGVGEGEGMPTGVDVGEATAVKVGRGVAGVGCNARGVGGRPSTGRSPRASNRAAITVTTTTATAARLTKTGR